MKKYTTEYTQIEDKIKVLRFKEVQVPPFELLYRKINHSQPQASPYSFKSSLNSLERKLVGFVMAMPVALAAVAFFLYSSTGSEGVYLASNDVAGMEEANVRIINNIVELENIGN